jgi:DNA-damage-inducible protein J
VTGDGAGTLRLYRSCGTLVKSKETIMAKTATINVRVDEAIKAKAEKILGKLGISMSDTISLLLNQIVLQKGIPFEAKIPNAETQQAMRDLEAGRGERFDGTADEFLESIRGQRKKPAK